MPRPILLVTCFEPFGGSDRNASQEAVMAMPDKIGPFDVRKACLPVVFGEAGARVCELVDELSPVAVVCVGEAGGTQAIAIETRATNLRQARIADNAGQAPQDEPVVEGGTDWLAATLPVGDMVAAVEAAGIPAEPSQSAGTFVCNDTLYLVLDHLRNTDVPAGFIHVPAGDALSNEQLAAGLTAAIAALGIKTGNRGQSHLD